MGTIATARKTDDGEWVGYVGECRITARSYKTWNGAVNATRNYVTKYGDPRK